MQQECMHAPVMIMRCVLCKERVEIRRPSRSAIAVASNGAHRYNHDLASADSSKGAGDGCPMSFVNFWVLGWSSDP